MFDLYGAVGALVVGTGAIALSALIIRKFSWGWVSSWVSKGNLWPPNTEKRRLITITVLGALISGLGCYLFGNSTAQDVVDMLAQVGMIVIGLIVVAVLIGIALANYTPSNKRSNMPRKNRRRTRRRSG